MSASAHPRLVVIPTDPISAYEKQGLDWLRSYYNPCGFFSEVFAVSPLETGRRRAHEMTILGVRKRAFAKTLADLKPDVIRAYGGSWPSDLAVLCRPPGVPLAVSIHDAPPVRPHGSVRHADRVLCVSNVVVATVRDMGVPADRVRMLPNRVDLRRFHPNQDRVQVAALNSRFPSGRHILHVGRLTRQKNQDTLIRALAELPAEYSAVFIGAGDRRPYESLAQRMGVSHRCFWVGSIPNAELPLWYSWCDCMCTPSRYEGFGIVFIEAAACATPNVTADRAPMNEYLTHDRSACLVSQYEDPSALASAIRRVCEDTDYRAILSKGALEAAKTFDSDRIDRMERDIYQELVGLRSRAIPPSARFRIRCSMAGQRCLMAFQRARAIGSRLAHRERHGGDGAPEAVDGSVAAWRNLTQRILRRVRSWVWPSRVISFVSQQTGSPSNAERVLGWIRNSESNGGGIRVHSGSQTAYPEISGYLIPTLLQYGETVLADRLLRWLVAIQRPDGSYCSPDGIPFVFDTGQVLRGLLAGLGRFPQAERAASLASSWLLRQMTDEGRSGFGPRYTGDVPETVHLYVLPPLLTACRLHRDSQGEDVVMRCADYYCRHPGLLDTDKLTHFAGYEIEALIELGREATVLSTLDALAAMQRSDGSLRGVGGVRWVCVPGLAQLAVCWYRTGRTEPADKAMAWLDRHQLVSGGFCGSHGPRASYFPRDTIPWAAKYYLDAHHLRVAAFIDRHVDDFPSSIDRTDGRFRAVSNLVKPQNRVLEVGCGKGRFLKALSDEYVGLSCTGVDISDKMLKHLPPSVQAIQGTQECLPVRSETFDVVFSVETVEHSINKNAAVREMIRAVKPGGYVAIIDKQRSHWGRLHCPSWERWPSRAELHSILCRSCDAVSVSPVEYGNGWADGLMLMWQGRRRSRLTSADWRNRLFHPGAEEEITNRVRHGALSEWAEVLLLNTKPGERVIELGSGTGEISLHLAYAGRKVTVLDLDPSALSFVRRCAAGLSCEIQTVEADATAPLPFSNGEFDCVWSSGLLEHFRKQERDRFLPDWGRISSDRLVIMVPNATCIPYQAWKAELEDAGEWPYGYEEPMSSLVEEFASVDVPLRSEFTVGFRHASTMRSRLDPFVRSIRRLLARGDTGHDLAQGYLRVGIGRKRPAST